MAKVLSQRGKPGEQAANAALARDLSKLKRQRAVVYAALRAGDQGAFTQFQAAGTLGDRTAA